MPKKVKSSPPSSLLLNSFQSLSSSDEIDEVVPVGDESVATPSIRSELDDQKKKLESLDLQLGSMSSKLDSLMNLLTSPSTRENKLRDENHRSSSSTKNVSDGIINGNNEFVDPSNGGYTLSTHSGVSENEQSTFRQLEASTASSTSTSSHSIQSPVRAELYDADEVKLGKDQHGSKAYKDNSNTVPSSFSFLNGNHNVMFATPVTSVRIGSDNNSTKLNNSGSPNYNRDDIKRVSSHPSNDGNYKSSTVPVSAQLRPSAVFSIPFPLSGNGIPHKSNNSGSIDDERDDVKKLHVIPSNHDNDEDLNHNTVPFPAQPRLSAVSPHPFPLSGNGMNPDHNNKSSTPSHSDPFGNPFLRDGNGNHKLPTLEKIPITGTTVDQYMEWRRTLIHNVSLMPKYNGILTEEPDASWQSFLDQYPHTSVPFVEKGYLDSHQVISAYISGAIPSSMEVNIANEMQSNPTLYHLPTLLGLSSKGNYNAHGLLQMLDSNYMMRTNYRLYEVMGKLLDLRYNGSDDPTMFIHQFKELHHQGKLLVPSWPHYKDDILAQEILLRLPKELEMIRTLIMNRGPDHPKSIGEVEEALKLWWISQSQSSGGNNNNDHYGNTPHPGNQQRGGNYKKKFFNHNHSSTPNTSSSSVNSNLVSYNKRGNKHHGNNNSSRRHSSDEDKGGPMFELG
jgi:hypothetical protein